MKLSEEGENVKMTKTKEDYNGMNAKMTYAKGSITRSYNTIDSLCVRLEVLLARGKKNFPEKTAKKLSVDIDNKRATMDKQMENLENAGKNLKEVIADMKAEETKLKNLDEMAAEVNLEIKEYNDK